MLRVCGTTIASIAVCLIAATAPRAEPLNMGPDSCTRCHEAEYEVWQASEHAKSYETVHRSDKGKDIAKALGQRRMQRNDTCVLCHYTLVDQDGRLKDVAGPSCESCHGPASDWFQIHKDFGGEDVEREEETAEHRAQRIAASAHAGMIWPHQTYDIARNCLGCHGLAKDALSGETIVQMLEAGHPINPEFELVRYSQGSVRHRFYPPDVTTNAEMTPAELSRFFLAGQAAALVSATAALGKSDHPKYQAAQQARIEAARTALGAIEAEVPEAGALAAEPTEENARALVAAIEGRDLSGKVEPLLPDAADYK